MSKKQTESRNEAFMKRVAACFDDQGAAMELMRAHVADRRKKAQAASTFLSETWVQQQEAARQRRLNNNLASPVSLLADHLDESDAPSIYGGRPGDTAVQRADIGYYGRYDS